PTLRYPLSLHDALPIWPDHRSRLYLRRDIERLAQRKQAGRGAARGAAQSLDRGLPVMETAISLIRPDSPYYRGRAAVAMVRVGRSEEHTSELQSREKLV